MEAWKGWGIRTTMQYWVRYEALVQKVKKLDARSYKEYLGVPIFAHGIQATASPQLDSRMNGCFLVIQGGKDE